MESVIKKIYERRLGYPRSISNDKEYQEVKNNYDKAYQTLENTLNEEQKKMLSDLFVCGGEVQGVMEYLQFKKGFSAGIQLGMEIYELKED